LPDVPAHKSAEALEMLDHLGLAGRITLGSTKGDDGSELIEALRLLQITPHVAQDRSGRSSAIDQARVLPFRRYRSNPR